MEDMPRPRPPHLHRQVTRHGKAVWYVRIGKGPSRCWRTGLGPWRAEDRSYDRREQWRDHFATQGTVWMDQRRDADALHESRRPRTPRPRRWPHAGERKSNFYSLTYPR